MSKLSEIVKIKGGKRLPKGENLQTKKNSHPYIRVRDLGGKYISKSELEYVPDNVFPKIKNYIVNENDVLISIVGTVGLVSIVDKQLDSASQTENCAKLSGLNNIDAQYLFYFLISDIGKSEIAKGVVGAVQPKLPLYSIENIEIDWKTEEQRKYIVQVLSSLDDKIQLNTQINQTLEQIAQAIFKSWFIDFNPVRAKVAAKAQGATDEQAEQAAMSIISGKSPAELTAYRQTHPHDYQKLAQLARHFPSEFEVIDGVEVPKGWGRVSIADKNVLEIIKPKINSFQGEKEYIATANVSGNSIVGDLELISYDNRPSRANMQPIANSIWFAKMVGEHKAILIDENDKFLIEETILSTGFMGLKPKKNKKCFLYCYINSEFFLNEKNQLATGAVQIALNNGSFSRIKITLPSDEVLEKFEHKLEKIFSLISENQKENKILAKSRDLLLPKLLNGEI